MNLDVRNHPLASRLFSIILIGLWSACAWAYPPIYNDANVQLNQWTYKYNEGLATAKRLNRPAMIAFVNQGFCSYCAQWDAGVLSNSDGRWNAFLQQNPMVLIWIDQQKESYYSSPSWDTLIRGNGKWTQIAAYPSIVMLNPDGSKNYQFLARQPYQQYPAFYDQVRVTTDQWPVNSGPGTIGLTAGTAAVGEGAGTLTATVSRTGGSAGAQSFSYATANGTAVAGTDYTATAGTLSWAAGDAASKTFTVPLLNNNKWTSPTTRTFTVTLAKVTGDATVGTTAQTVTITEASPYAPGTVGFASATGGAIHEGAVFTGMVTRTQGAVGGTTGTLSVTSGHTAIPSQVIWADGESNDKTFTVSVANTPGYDPRSFVVQLAVSGSASAGITNQTVTVLDGLVSQTFAAYQASNPTNALLGQASGVWFYNSGEAALRGEPLPVGGQAALTWTAPGSGRFSFKARSNVEADGVFAVSVGGDTNVLSDGYQTLSVLVNSGDVVRWTAQAVHSNYFGMVKDLAWEPLHPVAGTGFSPAAESKFQIDAVRANKNWVNLVWQLAGANPADAQYRLFAGRTAASLTNQVPGANSPTGGVNAIDLGIVQTNAAQGWVYWRVDSVLTGATARVALQTGPVWRFAVIDLPSFAGAAPGAGSTVVTFLRAGSSISVPAESATPVTYSATGLPTGLSINPQTGVISGTPSRAGAYTVTVTASNSEGSTTLTFTVAAQPLPAYATGDFEGALLDGNEVVCGTLSLSVSSSGSLSAKVIKDGVSSTLRGTWVLDTNAGVCTAQLTARAGTLNLALTPNGILTGDFGGASLLARHLEPTRAGAFTGNYTALLDIAAATPYSPAINNIPQGDGYVAFSVSSRGAVRYSGLLADGTKLSGSSSIQVYTGAELISLGYTNAVAVTTYACFPVYKSLFMRRGVVAGLLVIDAGDVADLADNRVFILGSEWVYPGRSAALSADGFAAAFDNGSAKEIGAYLPRFSNLAAAFAGAAFQCNSQSVTVMASGSSIALPSGNPLNASLRASSSSGLISGQVEVPDARGVRRHVSYKGVLVPALRAGGGYYLIRDNSVSGYSVNRSHLVEITY